MSWAFFSSLLASCTFVCSVLCGFVSKQSSASLVPGMYRQHRRKIERFLSLVWLSLFVVVCVCVCLVQPAVVWWRVCDTCLAR